MFVFSSLCYLYYKGMKSIGYCVIDVEAAPFPPTKHKKNLINQSEPSYDATLRNLSCALTQPSVFLSSLAINHETKALIYTSASHLALKSH